MYPSAYYLHNTLHITATGLYSAFRFDNLSSLTAIKHKLLREAFHIFTNPSVAEYTAMFMGAYNFRVAKSFIATTLPNASVSNTLPLSSIQIPLKTHFFSPFVGSSS